MAKINAKAYIDRLDESEAVQRIMQDATQVAAIRSYVDNMRQQFPDTSDYDLGCMSMWACEFILAAYNQHGENASPQILMMTFAVMARELLLLEASPGVGDPA